MKTPTIIRKTSFDFIGDIPEDLARRTRYDSDSHTFDVLARLIQRQKEKLAMQRSILVVCLAKQMTGRTLYQLLGRITRVIPTGPGATPGHELWYLNWNDYSHRTPITEVHFYSQPPEFNGDIETPPVHKLGFHYTLSEHQRLVDGINIESPLGRATIEEINQAPAQKREAELRASSFYSRDPEPKHTTEIADAKIPPTEPWHDDATIYVRQAAEKPRERDTDEK